VTVGNCLLMRLRLALRMGLSLVRIAVADV